MFLTLEQVLKFTSITANIAIIITPIVIWIKSSSYVDQIRYDRQFDAVTTFYEQLKLKFERIKYVIRKVKEKKEVEETQFDKDLYIKIQNNCFNTVSIGPKKCHALITAFDIEDTQRYLNNNKKDKDGKLLVNKLEKNLKAFKKQFKIFIS